MSQQRTTAWKKTDGGEYGRLHAYFAASNTRDGFLSRYETCFRERAQRIYLLMGGPGTGKSTLLFRIAREATARGLEVETYYCSSDPNSLDGVLVLGGKETFAAVDATAPHVMVPKLPGVREEIIPLGQFWKREVLAEKSGEIARLNREKAAAYERTYRYLSAVGSLSDDIRDRAAAAYNRTKTERLGDRLLRDIPASGEGKVVVGLDSAFGMRGRERLDTYLRLGKRVCILQNKTDAAYFLMDYLVLRAERAGWNIRISYDPILPDRVNALCFTDSQTAFLVCEPEEIQNPAFAAGVGRVVNCGNLLDAQRIAKDGDMLRRCQRLRQELTGCAVSCMQSVEKAHFALEKHYRNAMDFAAKEDYTRTLVPALFAP